MSGNPYKRRGHPPPSQGFNVRFGADTTPKNFGDSNKPPGRIQAAKLYITALKLNDKQKIDLEELHTLSEHLEDRAFTAASESQNEARELLAVHLLDSVSREEYGSRWSTRWSHKGKAGGVNRVLLQW